MDAPNKVLFVLLILACVTIFILLKLYKNQQRSAINAGKQIEEQKALYEKQIEEQKTLYEKQIEEQKALYEKQIEEQKVQSEKQIEEQKTFHKKQLDEIERRHVDELSAREDFFIKQLNEVQSRIEVHKEELCQKNEKDLLIDVLLGIEALSNSQKTGFSKVSGDLDDVKAIKDNMYNIGDSILNDISAAHIETITKLGVHGDMTVASILADLFEMMSKG